MKKNKNASDEIPQKSHVNELRDLKERKDAETKVLEKLLIKIKSDPSAKDTK